MELSPPRGTQDFLPPHGDRLRALYDRAAELARLHGFRYVETPDFEHTELFARTVGTTTDIVSKEMYTFTDRGDRSLTLRPEGTAPVMRAYLNRMHELGRPFKAFYLARMFRYDRPQAGRYREHRQFGVETFGVDDPSADVEVIAVGDRFVRDAGLSRYEIQINSIGDEKCRPAYRSLLLEYLRANRDRLHDEHRQRLDENPLRVLDCKDEACRAVAADAPRIDRHLCAECAEHFDGVLRGLEDEGLKPVLTPTLVRGLDYYTRTAFEFVSDVLSKQQGTLFGGGRYDGLAEALGGPRVPGVGFGMGLERVLLALGDEGVEPPGGASLDVWIVAFGPQGDRTARELARRFRERGISCDGPEAGPLGKQMKGAGRSGAAFAAVIGERESAAGTVTLKRLADGEQRELGTDEAIAWIVSERAPTR